MGIILFKMVAGRHPLAPRMGRELMITGLLDQPMPSVRAVCSQVSPQMPDDLAEVIDACLRKRKEQRMDSARALLTALEPLVPGRSERTLRADESPYAGLRMYTEPGYLGTVLRKRARRRRQHIVLFVDQFEELYTLVTDARERQAFTACLASVADDATTPLRVIVSIRSDFLDRVSEDPQFAAELVQGLFFCRRPTATGCVTLSPSPRR